MRSRDWSEKLMPSVPMEMPSLTPTVLKRMPTMPAAATPSFTCSAEIGEVHVAGVAFVPDAGDAHLRLGHVASAHAGRDTAWPATLPAPWAV